MKVNQQDHKNYKLIFSETYVNIHMVFHSSQMKKEQMHILEV
jgi:hypothetical protein